MKRKGFTLIEMMAVIAILGILVLTVLPNILKTYRNSKKMAFIDEAKVVYSKVTDDFVLNKTKGKRVNYVSNEEENHYTLDLQNEKDLKYTITLNNKGVVTGFLLKNTEFCIVGVGDFLSDYTTEQVIDLRDNGNGVDGEAVGRCFIETFQNDTELYLDLVNKISDSDEGATLAKPDLLTLKYGSGWYDRQTKESLSEGDGYSIRTIPHKYNHYYEKSTTDNIDVVSCNGTLLLDEQGNTKDLQQVYSKGEMRKKAVSEFSKKFYIVNFKLNEKETGSIEPITCYYGESCQLPNNVDNNGYGLSIKKTGYLFKGWKYEGITFENNGTLPSLNDDNEDKVVNGIDYNKFKFDNAEICKNGENTNNRNKKPFEAIWDPIKYMVSYNCNGGIGTMVNTNHTYDEEKKLRKNTCLRAGYIFEGWSKTETGNKEFNDEESVKNLTANNNDVVKLYAKWTQCSAGTYSSLAMTTCEPCPAGRYSSAGASSCLTCAAGTYSLAGSSRCTNCSAGTYQPNTGKSSCINCPAGTYQPNTAQTSCIRCVAGSYQNQTGKTSCIACAKGKTSAAGATAVCTTNCSNSTGVASWKTPVWNSNNTMTNLCAPNSCINTHRIEGNKCVLNQVEWVFNYTGGVQEFPIPYTGTYKLEVWGAQGGSCDSPSPSSGGLGGYSSGTIYLTAGGKLYVVVGGSSNTSYGGYNGGGNGAWGGGTSESGPQWALGGGGATHIATLSGELSSLSNNTDAILIVAGGGGGSGYNGGCNIGTTCYTNGRSACHVKGGPGGGENGGSGEDDVNFERTTLVGRGASQSGAGSTNNNGFCGVGSFGKGGDYCDDHYGGAGGGGGWYGGGGSSRGHAGGGGGSGYIGGVSNGTMSLGTRSGHGIAKITFISSN